MFGLETVFLQRRQEADLKMSTLSFGVRRMEKKPERSEERL